MRKGLGIVGIKVIKLYNIIFFVGFNNYWDIVFILGFIKIFFLFFRGMVKMKMGIFLMFICYLYFSRWFGFKSR